MEIGLVWYALAVYLATQSPPGATSGLKAVSGEHVLAKKLHPADDLMEGSTTSQLDLFWPANFRPIPQKDSAWDAHTAKETENRQGEVGFLRYSPYGP